MKLSKLVWVAVLALLLGACATGPRSVDISYDQLQSALSRRFPVQDRYLELLDLQATNPQLTLMPQQNRLRVDIALTALERLLRRPLQGDLSVTFVPRYEATDASVRLADVRVERFDLQGMPNALREPMRQFGPFFAQRVLEGARLHQFSPEQVQRAQGFTPSEIRVTGSGLRITLVPPP